MSLFFALVTYMATYPKIAINRMASASFVIGIG